MIHISELDNTTIQQVLKWKDAWFITYQVYYEKTENHPTLDDTTEIVSGNINIHPFMFVDSLQKDFARVKIEAIITITFFKKLDGEDLEKLYLQ